jgi:hypothetical protein
MTAARIRTVITSSWRYLGPALLLVGLGVFSYYNQLKYHYLVPPGGDATNHIQIVSRLLAGETGLLIHFHSLWYVLTIIFMRLTGMSAVTAMAWLGPGLLVSATVALYLFNRRFFGPTAGAVAATVFSLMTLQPLQTLNDGGFPNVLAAGTVLPLTLMAVEWPFSSRRPWLAVVVAIGAVMALLLAHHITALYGGLIIILFLFIQLLKWLERRPLGKILVLVVPGLLYGLLVGLTHLLLTSHFASTIQGLASSVVTTNSIFPYIHLTGHLDNPNAIIDLSNYRDYIGWAPVYLGIGGLIGALGWLVFGRESAGKRGATLLILWTTILAVASQQNGLGFPIRLARDLAVPLTLLVGLLAQMIVSYVHARQLPRMLGWLVIILCLSLGWGELQQRLIGASVLNPLVYHLAVDQQAAEKITQVVPENSRIVLFYDDAYLPEFIGPRRVILATSQSAEKLADPRQVSKETPTAQYVYVERRYDRDLTAVNHDGVIKSYLHSPLMELVFQFHQPEKAVYFFKVKTVVAQTAKKTTR